MCVAKCRVQLNTCLISNSYVWVFGKFKKLSVLRTGLLLVTGNITPIQPESLLDTLELCQTGAPVLFKPPASHAEKQRKNLRMKPGSTSNLVTVPATTEAGKSDERHWRYLIYVNKQYKNCVILCIHLGWQTNGNGRVFWVMSFQIRVGKAGRVSVNSLQLHCFVYDCNHLWM